MSERPICRTPGCGSPVIRRGAAPSGRISYRTECGQCYRRGLRERRGGFLDNPISFDWSGVTTVVVCSACGQTFGPYLSAQTAYDFAGRHLASVHPATEYRALPRTALDAELKERRAERAAARTAQLEAERSARDAARAAARAARAELETQREAQRRKQRRAILEAGAPSREAKMIAHDAERARREAQRAARELERETEREGDRRAEREAQRQARASQQEAQRRARDAQRQAREAKRRAAEDAAKAAKAERAEREAAEAAILASVVIEPVPDIEQTLEETAHLDTDERIAALLLAGHGHDGTRRALAVGSASVARVRKTLPKKLPREARADELIADLTRAGVRAGSIAAKLHVGLHRITAIRQELEQGEGTQS